MGSVMCLDSNASLHLLVHCFEVKVIPAFDNFAVACPNHDHSGEVDGQVERNSAESIASVDSGNHATGGREIALGYLILNRDLNVGEGGAEGAKHRFERRDIVDLFSVPPKEVVDGDIGCEEPVDGCFVSLVPNFFEPCLQNHDDFPPELWVLGKFLEIGAVD